MKLPDYYKAIICEDYDPKDMKYGFAVYCPECKQISYTKTLYPDEYIEFCESRPFGTFSLLHKLVSENMFCTQCGCSFIKEVDL